MVSIVIPTYNRSYIIGRTLDCIISQTYTDWECLVVDDYSTDDTHSTVCSYIQKDSRIRFLSNQNRKGAQGARNTGIKESIGEWIVLFDSDNVMHPDFLEKCMLRQRESGCDVVNTWSNVIDSNNSSKIGSFAWTNYGQIHNKLLTGACYVDNSSTIIRKCILEDIGYLSEDCPAFQEWDTHIRLSHKASYQTIEEFLIDYYSGAADAISSNKSKDVKGYLYILSKFRSEWIRKHIFHFCKYSAILGVYIDKLNPGDKEKYQTEYIRLCSIFYPVIILLSHILKKKIK